MKMSGFFPSKIILKLKHDVDIYGFILIIPQPLLEFWEALPSSWAENTFQLVETADVLLLLNCWKQSF